MIITAEVPTGEHRPVKPGEWGRTASGEVWCNVGLQDSTHEYDIVTRHEIEVPEGAKGLFSYFTGVSGVGIHIALPRPKVKREGWVNIFGPQSIAIKDSYGRYTSRVYPTEQEAREEGAMHRNYITTVHVGPWEE